MFNTSINACYSTGEKISIPFEKVFFDNGNQKEFERRSKEERGEKTEKLEAELNIRKKYMHIEIIYYFIRYY